MTNDDDQWSSFEDQCSIHCHCGFNNCTNAKDDDVDDQWRINVVFTVTAAATGVARVTLAFYFKIISTLLNDKYDDIRSSLRMFYSLSLWQLPAWHVSITIGKKILLICKMSLLHVFLFCI